MLDVQRLLVRLHLVLEALLPGFNRYHGAHAIGAASALWVVRPSKRTRPAVAAAGAMRADARIYSRGGASRESPAPELPAEILAGVGPADWVDASDLIEAAIQLPHQGPRRRWPDVMAVDLGRFYGSSALRVLMAAPSGARLLVVGDARALAVARQGPAERLVGARFATSTIVEPPPVGLLSATPVPTGELDDVAWVLRYLQEHHAAVLRNAWREALCALAARRGGACTKNAARSLIEATPMRVPELGAHLLDLPSHRLGVLVGAVEQTVEQTAEKAEKPVEETKAIPRRG
jgi:hypothetical protein